MHPELFRKHPMHICVIPKGPLEARQLFLLSLFPHLPTHGSQRVSPCPFLHLAVEFASWLMVLRNARASQCTGICPSLGLGSLSGGSCSWKILSQPQQYVKGRQEMVSRQLLTVLPSRRGLSTRQTATIYPSDILALIPA